MHIKLTEDHRFSVNGVDVIDGAEGDVVFVEDESRARELIERGVAKEASGRDAEKAAGPAENKSAAPAENKSAAGKS